MLTVLIIGVIIAGVTVGCLKFAKINTKTHFLVMSIYLVIAPHIVLLCFILTLKYSTKYTYH